MRSTIEINNMIECLQNELGDEDGTMARWDKDSMESYVLSLEWVLGEEHELL